MANVAATFTANIAPFQAAMGKMATSVKAGTSAASNAGQRIGGSMVSIGKASTIAGVAVGAMSVGAIKSYGNFQNSINKAAVVAGSSSKDLKGNMSDLEKEAESLGAKLPISAQDAGDAMVEMARNGASIKDLKTEFPAIAKAAAVTGEDLSGTAVTVQNAMNIWGGGAKNAAKDSAILAKNANLSKVGIGDMGQAFANVGSTAKTLGMGVATTSTAIGLMANSGLDAAQGSQDLAHALTQMTKPSKAAQSAMSELGISYTDAKGNFKSFPSILKEVASATDGMSKSQKVATLTTLFGAAGEKAMLPLLNSVTSKTKDGKSKWDKYAGALNGVSSSSTAANKYLTSNANNMNKNVGAALDQMGDDLKNLVFSGVAQAAPALTKLFNIIGNIATNLSKSKGPMATFLKNLIAWSPVIAGVLVVVGLLTSGIGKMITSFNSIVGAAKAIGGGLQAVWGIMAANPIVALIVVIAALVAGLVYFFTQTTTGKKLWSSFISWLKSAWSGIKAFFSGLWSGIVGIFNDAVNGVKTGWDSVTTFFSNLWTGIVNGAMSAWNGLTSFLSGIWTGIVNVATSIWNGLGFFLTALWQGIVTVAISIWNGLVAFFTALWTIVSTIFTTVWNTIATVLTTIWTTIVTVATTIWNGLVAFFTTLWATVSTIFSTVWNTIVSVLTAIWSAIVSVATGIWNGLASFFSSLLAGVSSVFSSVWNAIKSFLTGLWNGIKSTASSVWNGITSTISSAVSAASSVVKSIWNGLRSFISGLWSSVRSIVSSAWNSIRSVITSIARGIVSSVRGTWSAFTGIVSNVVSGIRNGFNALRSFSLAGAGRAIMDSFLSGLRSIWGNIQNFVGNIAGWIKSHKGPISYDAKLLIPAGNAIMGGLNQGLQKSFGAVQKTVSGMASDISDSMSANINGLSMAGAQFSSGDVTQSIDANERITPNIYVQNNVDKNGINSMVKEADANDAAVGSYFRPIGG